MICSGDRILIRSPNWLGDAVMAIPALQFWMNRLPDRVSIAVLAPAALHPLWRRLPGIVDTLTADAVNPVVTADAVRCWKPDVALVLPNSPRTAAEVWCAAVPIRVGFTGRWRAALLTHAIDRPRQTGPLHHQGLDTLHLLRATGLMPGFDAANGEPLFDPRESLPAPVMKRPSAPSGMPDKGYLLLCPGAEYGPAKRWIPERFAATASHIAASHEISIVLAGSENDVASSRHVERHLSKHLGASCINLTGTTNLDDFMAWVAHANLVLCNDSGAMHLAALFSTPGVAVFGSTEPEWTGPVTRSVQVVRADVPCSPCFLRDCPIDFRCMKSLDTASVVDACSRRLHVPA